MAALWGAGKEPFIGFCEDLFDSDGIDQQCSPLTGDVCASLPNLDFMPLDAGGFGSVGGLLGTFHGCIDSSIISIIEDSGSLAESKDHLEEETEVTLLTALTEILDNVDDENLSPFDALPESDLLGSAKDKDGSSLRKLFLSRTPPEHETPPVDNPGSFRTFAATKVDASCTGRLGNTFSGSFDRAVTRRQSCARGSRKIPVLQVKGKSTQQRSDGEEEEVCSLGLDSSSEVEDVESDSSSDYAQANTDGESAQCLPYIIINKERLALNELVQYIHSYSLPPLSEKEESVKRRFGEASGPFMHKVKPLQEKDRKVPEGNKGPLLYLKPWSGVNVSNFSTVHKRDEIDRTLASLQKTTIPENEKILEMRNCSDADMGLLQVKEAAFPNSGELPEQLKSAEFSQGNTKIPSSLQVAASLVWCSQASTTEKNNISSNTVAISASVQGDCLLAFEGQEPENADPTVESVKGGRLRPNNALSEECRNVAVKKHASEVPAQENMHNECDASGKEQKAEEPLSVDKQLNEAGFALSGGGMESLVNPTNENGTSGVLQRESLVFPSQGHQENSSNQALESKHLEQLGVESMDIKECRPRRELGGGVNTAENNTASAIKSAYEVRKRAEGARVDKVVHLECDLDIPSPDAQEHATEKDDLLEDKQNKTISEMKHVNESSGLSAKSEPFQACNAESSSLNRELLGYLTCDPAQDTLDCRTASADKVSSSPKEIKPKMLSLEQYRQRMQQRKPVDTKKEDSLSQKSKWPSVPELPDGLAEIPCLTVPITGAKVVPAKPVQTEDAYKSQKCSAVSDNGTKCSRSEDKKGAQKCASVSGSDINTFTTKKMSAEGKRGAQKCPPVPGSGTVPTKQIKTNDKSRSQNCLSASGCGIASAKQLGAEGKNKLEKTHPTDTSASAFTFENTAVSSYETGVSSAQTAADLLYQVPQKLSSDLFQQPSDSYCTASISTAAVPCVPNAPQSIPFSGQGAPVQPVGYVYPSSGTAAAASYLAVPQSTPPCNIPPPVWPTIPPPGYQGLPPPAVTANAYPYSSYQAASVAPLQIPSWPSAPPMIYETSLGAALPQTGSTPYTQPLWPSVPVPTQNPTEFFMHSPPCDLVQKAVPPFLNGQDQSFMNTTTILGSKPLYSCWSDHTFTAPNISVQDQVAIQKMPEKILVQNVSETETVYKAAAPTQKRELELEEAVQITNNETFPGSKNPQVSKVTDSLKYFAPDKTFEIEFGIQNKLDGKVPAAQEKACEVQAEIQTMQTKSKFHIPGKSKVCVPNFQTKGLDVPVSVANVPLHVLEFESNSSNQVKITDTAVQVGNISNDSSEPSTWNKPELRGYLEKSHSSSEKQPSMDQNISSVSSMSGNVTDLKCLELKLNGDAKQNVAFLAASKKEPDMLLEGDTTNKSLPVNISFSVCSGSSDKSMSPVSDQCTVRMCQKLETAALASESPNPIKPGQIQFSPEKCRSLRSSKACKAASRRHSSAVRKMNLKVPVGIHGGIEATDVTSLLEQFEESQAEEQKHTSCPDDSLAVGNTGLASELEKKHLDRVLGPELASTAGLTPPATPPHQAWKPLAPISLLEKQMSPNIDHQEETETCASKSIKSESQAFVHGTTLKNAPSPNLPIKNTGSLDVQLGFGDHDYCLRNNPQPATSQSSSLSTAVQVMSLPRQSPPDKGSRWNVKHCQVITIKPIGTDKEMKCVTGKQSIKRPTSGDGQQSTEVIPQTDDSVRNTCKDSLDYRTSERNGSKTLDTVNSVTCSNIPPCNKDPETKRKQKRCSPPSNRPVRCYRRQRTPSPEESYRRSRRSRSSHRRRKTNSHSSGSSHSSTSSGSERSSYSRSPPAKRRRRRQRYRSRSSEYSSRSSSRSHSSLSRESHSRSRSRSWSSSHSRSPSPYRSRGRTGYRRYEYGSWDNSCQSNRMQQKQRAIEERRVIYIGKIHNGMTRAELKERFSVFGEIEECTLHFREEGDNYGFVTYFDTKDAFRAIENGHKLRLPNELGFDLCFGGRRQFCKSTYADLDCSRDEFDPAPVRSKFNSLDFDTLLRQAQRNIRR